MANGFCPNLLLQIRDVAGSNDPSLKMQVAGFLAALFCCQNSQVSPLNEAFDGAHKRGLTVAYKRRSLVDEVVDEDTCDINRIPAKLEWNFPALNRKQHAFYLEDSLIQQYCRDASSLVGTGRPPTQVMLEVYSEILNSANVLLKAINQDLVTEMATQFGDNVTIAASVGKVINISRDGDKLILDNGILDMLRDFQENELCATPCIVGGGLWAAWDLAKIAACCNAAGFDTGRIGLPSFFFDKDSQNIWGVNSAGVLAPGSVKFIGRNKFQGAFAGQKGTSFFTTLPMPVNEFPCNMEECLRNLVFDLQLKYEDCPTTIDLNGVDTSVGRGWSGILSKEYVMWVQPRTGYADGDELAGTNGTLKYFLENTTDAGGSGTYGY